MLIVSQDRNSSLNLDRLDGLTIGKNKGEKEVQVAGISRDNYLMLGKYKTEERAKEVLQEIIRAYRDYRTAECDGYTNVLQETAVFNMPED